MYSIRNILVTIALLSAVPLSLGAPETNQDDAIAQYNPNEPTPDDAIAPYNPRDAEEDLDDPLDAEEVLNILEARAVHCGITSAPRQNCQLIACPPDQQCKVTRTGRCGWKKPKRQRPVGCSACKCYVRES
ncbi:hypothetical protein K469DRAFT_690839 [Zopfia rhizophila CBS 207.26]|uniref:Uncharacterized protein n=1 Tax=Zopfia rhizophila CBS 207.26 TaxID=1314779 RepID=A0A6A6DWL2_9PEZI|nr:hypothetical protein K469DRAFT_690839 [Zopfia rhizophila CBS 207.26]